MRREPKIGETLLYTLSEADILTIRDVAKRQGVLSVNPHEAGQIVPFIAVRLWPGEYPQNPEPLSKTGVNGQLILDGAMTLWRTSAGHGETPGYYQFAD